MGHLDYKCEKRAKTSCFQWFDKNLKQSSIVLENQHVVNLVLCAKTFSLKRAAGGYIICKYWPPLFPRKKKSFSWPLTFGVIA